MIGYLGTWETVKNDFQLFSVDEAVECDPATCNKENKISMFRWDGYEFSFEHIDLEVLQST